LVKPPLAVWVYHVDIGQDVRAKLDRVRDRIFQLLGSAVEDTIWGLLRPGLLVHDLAGRVASMCSKSYYHPYNM
jgi:hypothetical protein